MLQSMGLQRDVTEWLNTTKFFLKKKWLLSLIRFENYQEALLRPRLLAPTSRISMSGGLG